MRTVRTQTGTRISRLGPATETKSDRSEFIVRPVSCKRIKTNVWRSIRTHAGLSSSRSHVNTPLVHRGAIFIKSYPVCLRVRLLIAYTEGQDNLFGARAEWKGYVYCAALFVVAVGFSLVSQHRVQLMMTIGMRLQTALIGLVYEKVTTANL